jgi:cell division protein ZapE
LHAALHAATLAAPRREARALNGRLVHRRDAVADPIPGVAAALGASVQLLCVDELQLSDVADAGLLSRLLPALLRDHAVTLVATSNQPPAELFSAGGPARYYAGPLIAVLSQRCVLLPVDDGRDHRRGDPDARGAAAARPRGSWHVRSGDAPPSGLDEFDAAWAAAARASQPQAAPPAMRDIPVRFGRALRLLCASSGEDGKTTTTVGRASFDELCAPGGGADPPGVADHLAAAAALTALYLDGVPRLRAADVDACRRLVTLVDALYEARCALHVRAHCAPGDVFAALLATPAAAQRPSFGDAADVHAARPLSAEERLMCGRAASRLRELCGA